MKNEASQNKLIMSYFKKISKLNYNFWYIYIYIYIYIHSGSHY